MGAMSASGGAIRAVTDEQILDAYRFLAAHEGVFCEPASAAGVAGLLADGVPEGVGRVACVLTGHGLKDPQTALSQAGAVVAAATRRPPPSSASCSPRDASNRATGRRACPGVLGEPRAGLRRARRRAVAARRARGGRDRALRGPDRPAHRPRPAQPVRARLREARRPAATSSSASRPTSRSAAASGRAPPPTSPACSRRTRSSSSTPTCSRSPRSSRGTRTTSRRRCTAASSPASTATSRASASRSGSRRCSSSRDEAVRTRDARRALPQHVPMRRRRRQRRPHRAARARPRPRRPVADRPRPRTTGCTSRTAPHLYPRSAEIVAEAASLGALGATISGAGPTRPRLDRLRGDGRRRRRAARALRGLGRRHARAVRASTALDVREIG